MKTFDERKKGYIEREKARYSNRGPLYTQDVRGSVKRYDPREWTGFTREMQSSKGIFSCGKRSELTGRVLDYGELDPADRG